MKETGCTVRREPGPQPGGRRPSERGAEISRACREASEGDGSGPERRLGSRARHFHMWAILAFCPRGAQPLVATLHCLLPLHCISYPTIHTCKLTARMAVTNIHPVPTTECAVSQPLCPLPNVSVPLTTVDQPPDPRPHQSLPSTCTPTLRTHRSCRPQSRQLPVRGSRILWPPALRHVARLILFLIRKQRLQTWIQRADQAVEVIPHPHNSVSEIFAFFSMHQES